MGYLSEVERRLDMPIASKRRVLQELSDHYQETHEALIASGLPPGQADRETIRRLGDPAVTANRLSAVHAVAPLRTAFLTTLPFLCLLGTNVAGDLLGQPIPRWLANLPRLVFAVGTLWALRQGRRPLWLATWLPTAGMGLLDLMGQVYACSAAAWWLCVAALAASLTLCARLLLSKVRRLSRPRLPVRVWVALTAVGVLSVWDGCGHLADSALIAAAWIAPIVIAAAWAFHRHDEAHPFYASLSILTVYVWIWGTSPAALLAVAVAWLYSQLATWPQKAAILVLAVGLNTTAYLAIVVPRDHTISVLVSQIVFALAVLAPVLLHWRPADPVLD